MSHLKSETVSRCEVTKPIHPFPARMAPELAINELEGLPKGSTVLDPMSGSGTVLRHASGLGHKAMGRDMDPLAVLMSKVWTAPVDDVSVGKRLAELNRSVKAQKEPPRLPWIDEDDETRLFVNYWFGRKQQNQLRRIAFALDAMSGSRAGTRRECEVNVLKVALSRIIITKDQGASLARDTSHSRPHRVSTTSAYDVLEAFAKSVASVRKILLNASVGCPVEVKRGDARSLDVGNGSVDLVLTSPPYLNAIDYMRGHRMSLVWLGHRISDLRSIRSNSIGAERGPDEVAGRSLFAPIQDAMCNMSSLRSSHQAMVVRYSEDLYRMMSEVARVLKPGGRAIMVVGNSCLRGNFVRNSEGVIHAGKMVGLKLTNEVERELPDRNRYLPMPKEKTAPLGQRMRTESILSFASA